MVVSVWSWVRNQIPLQIKLQRITFNFRDKLKRLKLLNSADTPHRGGQFLNHNLRRWELSHLATNANAVSSNHNITLRRWFPQVCAVSNAQNAFRVQSTRKISVKLIWHLGRKCGLSILFLSVTLCYKGSNQRWHIYGEVECRRAVNVSPTKASERTKRKNRNCQTKNDQTLGKNR